MIAYVCDICVMTTMNIIPRGDLTGRSVILVCVHQMSPKTTNKKIHMHDDETQNIKCN